MTPRIIFQARNRRGLGHLMRARNIAHAIRALDPSVEITFYTRSEAARPLCAPFACVVAPETAGDDDWRSFLAHANASLVVYDTMPPAAHVGHPAVFIMRACKADEQRAVLDAPVLRQMQAIIVPHTREEFGFALPADLEARTRFTGPIVRVPQPDKVAMLRERYGLPRHGTVLVSTGGGGGFAQQSQAFFDVVSAAHTRLLPLLPELRHIVVRGPLFGGTIAPHDRMTQIDLEPDLCELFTLANLVIAEGGYNTVHELRQTGTPAVFLPGERKLDDQHARVRVLAELGMAEVLSTAQSPSASADTIARLLTNPARLAAMRAAHQAHPLQTGNRAAAECVLAALGQEAGHALSG